ncbi:hypothetical protein NL676_022022 [Syzygium grande]|nr:hypothetical protein NL676_022022 [Syzygium grande]
MQASARPATSWPSPSFPLPRPHFLSEAEEAASDSRLACSAAPPSPPSHLANLGLLRPRPSARPTSAAPVWRDWP